MPIASIHNQNNLCNYLISSLHSIIFILQVFFFSCCCCSVSCIDLLAGNTNCNGSSLLDILLASHALYFIYNAQSMMCHGHVMITIESNMDIKYIYSTKNCSKSWPLTPASSLAIHAEWYTHLSFVRSVVRSSSSFHITYFWFLLFFCQFCLAISNRKKKLSCS